jgi:hypothetical protein
LLADGMSKAGEAALAAEQLRIHNQKLTEKVKRLTFQPTVAGIYPSSTDQSNATSISPPVAPLDLFVPTSSRAGNVADGANPDGADIEQLAGAYVQDFLIDHNRHADAASKNSPFGRFWGGMLNSRTANSMRKAGFITIYDDHGRSSYMSVPKRRPPPEFIQRQNRINSDFVTGRHESTPQNIAKRYRDWNF